MCIVDVYFVVSFSAKWPNFEFACKTGKILFQKLERHCIVKQTVPQESNTLWLSFEWLRCKVSANDSKV